MVVGASSAGKTTTASAVQGGFEGVSDPSSERARNVFGR
jgi:hypothetical protein